MALLPTDENGHPIPVLGHDPATVQAATSIANNASATFNVTREKIYELSVVSTGGTDLVKLDIQFWDNDSPAAKIGNDYRIQGLGALTHALKILGGDVGNTDTAGNFYPITTLRVENLSGAARDMYLRELL